jgi:hypothetical protein
MLQKVVSRRRRFLLAAAAFCGVLVTAEVSRAQAIEASIFGRVTDESGAVLPGVTVTATSPALQVPSVTTVTDEKGEYRLTPLPIGTYAVTYELSGFQSFRREGLALGVGFAAKVDASLKVGSLEETVTVSGVSPVVDVKSTTTSTQFTREILDSLPLAGRNSLHAIMAQAPGVRTQMDIGGTTAGEPPAFRAFGQNGDAWVTNEGVVTTYASGSGFGQYVDYQALEEAAVQTVGNDAEMPTRGIRLITVVKSGGNQLHGSGMYARVPTRLQSNNLTDELIAQGVEHGAPLKVRYDMSFEAGGKIVENKLWWFGAVRRRLNQELVEGAHQPNGDPAIDTQIGNFFNVKLSYQMTPSHRLIGFWEAAPKWEQALEDPLKAWESRTNDGSYPYVGKVQWMGTFSNTFLADVQWGFSQISNRGYPNDRGPIADQVGRLAPYTRDIFTQVISGEWTTVGRRLEPDNTHIKAAITWYKPDAFYGSHDIKIGLDYLDGTYIRGFLSKSPNNYQRIFNNGVPFQIVTLGYPAFPKSEADYLGVYAKDSWSVGRQLTINAGLRYGDTRGYVEAACRDAGDFVAAQCFDRVERNTFRTLSPRIHAAYDLTGDGKTVVKGGFGRFHRPWSPNDMHAVNPFIAEEVTYRWRDLNGNRDYDPGEANLDRNGPDFVSIVGGATAFVNPDEKQQRSDQISLSVERELIANMGLRFTGIYSREMDILRTLNTLRPPETYSIPVTRPDPGFDGVAGNADDPGQTLTYWEYPVSLRGRQFERNVQVNSPLDNTYKSFEIASFKRLSNNWHALASYSATKLHVPVPAAMNPNAEIFSADDTWEWGAKVAGGYHFPGDISASTSFEHRSGTPWARTVLLTGGVTIPSITIRVEPLGARRLPNVNIMNVRVEKKLNIPGTSHNLRVHVNIYNFLNANTVLNVQMRSGRTFLQPAIAGTGEAILPPRIFELSATYSF